jgi:hypothetical protein
VISSAALKQCVNSIEKIIPFVYHKRGNKNNYAFAGGAHERIRDCSRARGAVNDGWRNRAEKGK